MKTAEENRLSQIDDLIKEHLSHFSENNLFRASIQHFIDTGKHSGSFRSALHVLVTRYASLVSDEKDRRIRELEAKAKKWDDLGEKIAKCYDEDDDGNPIDEDADLVTIGEIAASAYGFL